MDLLRPVIRPYPWGTRTAIAELQGRPVPAPGPEAELWMGAHPSAPSGVGRLSSPTTPPTPVLSTSLAPSVLSTPPAPSTPLVALDAVIAGDPERELGAECAARFGGRLPFLLKVLSAEKALSIQVHPSRAQAEAGFAAENARGLPPGDPGRNYVDDWPKPELLYALTRFEVAAGLRTPADAAAILRALAVDQLQPLVAALSAATSEQAMAGALASVLEWPEPGRAELVAAVVAACARLAAAGSRASGPSGGGPYADACAAAVRVAADHPGDLGVLALLLMRHEVLQPGQAVFMPAGGLHAYLQGTGIELLANSDNVVRAGLTGKHIDVPELLKLLDPSVSVPVLSPRVLADGIAWFDTPAPEFRLYLLDLAALPGHGPALALPGHGPALALPGHGPALALPGHGPALALPGHGPRILLCLDGACVLRAASGDAIELGRGDSCFVSAADAPVYAT